MKNQSFRPARRGPGRYVLNLVTGGVIAALYAGLTVALAPISFMNLQLRVAEALTILPVFTPAAIPGLTLGCLIANFVGASMGANTFIDVPVGALATLISALLTYWLRRYKIRGLPLLALLPPVVVNLLIIGAELSILYDLPLLLTMLQVGAGQLAACGGFGLPLYLALEKSRVLEKLGITTAQ